MTLAMVVMLGSTVLVILSRYISWLSLGYLTDLAVGLIPWVGMLGAAVALQRGRHIGMVLVRDALPGTVRFWIVAVSYLAVIGFLALLIWSGSNLVMRQIASGVTTSAMEFPRWLISLSLPVGAGLAALHQLVHLIAHLMRQPAAASADTFPEH